MSTWEHLVDQVEADSTRTLEEKETALNWNNDCELATVESYNPTIIRHLLQHPDFRPFTITVQSDSVHTSNKKKPSQVDSDDKIIGIDGHLPIGALRVVKSARSSNSQAQVVSH